MSRPVASRILISAFCVLSSWGCFSGSDVTRGPDERLGPGQWTVDGVAIGNTFEEVEALLGPGRQQSFREGAPGYYFDGRNTYVEFNADSVATRVSGQRLLRDGDVVLATGRPASAVVTALGQGYSIARFSPTTTGVFTTGSVPNGIEHYYYDGVDRFEIFVNRSDVIGGVHSGSIEGFPRPEG